MATAPYILMLPVSRELVTKVAEELVHKWIATLPQAQEQEDLVIGAQLGGGVYHGLTVHEQKPMRLITLPGEFSGTWKECMDWAEKQGGALPSRFDGLVQVTNAKADFQPEAYWLADVFPSAASSAWYQYSYFGTQYNCHQSTKLRARAVRRVKL